MAIRSPRERASKAGRGSRRSGQPRKRLHSARAVAQPRRSDPRACAPLALQAAGDAAEVPKPAEAGEFVGKRVLRLLGLTRWLRPLGFHVGELLLLTCTLLLSTNGVAVRTIYTLPSPPAAPLLATVRAGLAVGLFGLTLLARRLTSGGQRAVSSPSQSIDSNLVKESIKLGFLHGGAIALLLFSLQRTIATRAALLVATKNVLVPMFAAFSGKRVSWTTWLASALTTSGVLLMTTGSSPGGTGTMFSIVGDIAALGTAVFGSLFTVSLASNASKFPQNILTLAVGLGDFIVALVWTAASVIGAGLPALNMQSLLAPETWTLILWLAIAVDAIPRVLEVRGQSRVPATEGQAIFALEMILSSLFACAVLGERLTTRGCMGGGLITSGIGALGLLMIYLRNRVLIQFQVITACDAQGVSLQRSI